MIHRLLLSPLSSLAPAMLVIALAVVPVQIRAVELHVDEEADNNVTFYSDAPVEDFKGVTDRIDGYVYWEGDTLSRGANFPNSEFYFEVLLESIDTGIGMRNEDMRQDFLETDRYPYAKYRGYISRVSRDTANMFTVTVKGEMTIHGVTNDLQTINTVTRHGDRYRVASAFAVQLPDYDISVPELLFMRISETIELELDFWLAPAPEED